MWCSLSLSLSLTMSAIEAATHAGLGLSYSSTVAGVACSAGTTEPRKALPGLFSCAVTAGSPAVRLPPCQGGSGFGDEPCDRRSYSRIVGGCGHGEFGWPGHSNECWRVGWL